VSYADKPPVFNLAIAVTSCGIIQRPPHERMYHWTNNLDAFSPPQMLLLRYGFHGVFPQLARPRWVLASGWSRYDTSGMQREWTTPRA
jgi:hypothetical protein